MDRKQGGLFVFTPSITSDNGFWYRGTADAIAQNMAFLKKSHEPYAIIASADAVYKLDYNKVLERHVETGADIINCLQGYRFNREGFSIRCCNNRF